MIEDKDYIMRLTHEIARMLIRLIFGRDIDKEDELPVSVERLRQFKKLTAMIDDGQINGRKISSWMSWIRTASPTLRWPCAFMRSWGARARNSWWSLVLPRKRS